MNGVEKVVRILYQSDMVSTCRGISEQRKAHTRMKAAKLRTKIMMTCAP